MIDNTFSTIMTMMFGQLELGLGVMTSTPKSKYNYWIYSSPKSSFTRPKFNSEPDGEVEVPKNWTIEQVKSYVSNENRCSMRHVKVQKVV